MAKTILLADDSVTIQKVVELTFMEQNDFGVEAVSDGNAALERLPELQPALVIADVNMPGADGYEVCRRSKAQFPHIPVLLLVGTFEPFDEAQAQAAGADGFLKKPFDSQDLLRQVESLTSSAPAPAPAQPGDDLSTIQASDPVLAQAAAVTPPPAPQPPASEPATFAAPAPQEPAPALPGPADAEPSPFDALSFAPPPGEAAETPAEPTPIPEVAAPEPAPAPPAPEPAAPAAAAPEPAAPAPEPAPPAPEPAAPAPEPAAATSNGGGALDDETIERIARRVAELVGDRAVKEVAWEVIPDLAEVIIKDRIRELESQVD